MKNKFIIFAVMLSAFLLSCKKDEVIVQEEQETKKTEESVKETFDFTIKQEVRNNILVNDYVPLVIKNIATGDAKLENIVYKLTPVGNDATKHQKIGEDYVLYEQTREMLHPIRVNSLIIQDPNNISNLFIKPIEPGSFDLSFSMQKYDVVKKENVGDPVVRKFLFSAVKIEFDFPVEKNKHEFKFKFIDGYMATDNYLRNDNNGMKVYYESKYDGQTHHGEFWVGVHFHFKWGIPYSFYYDIKNFPKTIDIIITQEFTNGTKNIIKYEKINVY